MCPSVTFLPSMKAWFRFWGTRSWMKTLKIWTNLPTCVSFVWMSAQSVNVHPFKRFHEMKSWVNGCWSTKRGQNFFSDPPRDIAQKSQMCMRLCSRPTVERPPSQSRTAWSEQVLGKSPWTFSGFLRTHPVWPIFQGRSLLQWSCTKWRKRLQCCRLNSKHKQPGHRTFWKILPKGAWRNRQFSRVQLTSMENDAAWCRGRIHPGWGLTSDRNVAVSFLLVSLHWLSSRQNLWKQIQKVRYAGCMNQCRVQVDLAVEARRSFTHASLSRWSINLLPQIKYDLCWMALQGIFAQKQSRLSFDSWSLCLYQMNRQNGLIRNVII